MDLFTLDRNLKKMDIIDEFVSLTWVERFFGDSDVELSVPVKEKIIKKLPQDVFVGIDESDEVMILETFTIKDNMLKIQGRSLTTWLNNRFIRSADSHKTRSWFFEGYPPGEIIWTLVQEMCTSESAYLNGDLPMGIPDAYLERLKLPALRVRPYDLGEDPIDLAVPFGPLYDEVKSIATAFSIGIQIVRDRFPIDGKPISFRMYKGLNRTREQTENSIVRFSPSLDSLTGVQEIKDTSIYKNLAFGYSSGATDVLADPGVAYSGTASELSGFDLRADQEFFDDVSTDDDTLMVSLLSSRAADSLAEHSIVRMLDGEIVTTSQFQYKRDYNLGDIVEMQGNTDIYKVRIMEYIRSQDSSGEKRTTNVG